MTPRGRPPRLRRRTPQQRWWRGRVLTRYGRQALSVFVVVATLFLRERQPAIPPKREEKPPEVFGVDTRAPDERMDVHAVGMPMPSGPLPNQRRPPCAPRLERELMGACWIPHAEAAPCPGGAYEHLGRCYIPSNLPPRPATSIEE